MPTRCEYCAHVDHSVLYVTEDRDLKRCTYEGHGAYPPINAVMSDEGELMVSPTGTTCSNFLSRAW